MPEQTEHRSRFRPDIEGLRAIAVLLVLLYHAGIPGFTGGYLGVDVFFVLSGYLITGTLIREVRATGTVRLRDFYARRFRRLLPASALVLASTAAGIVVALPTTTWRDFGGDIAAAAGYVLNWRLALRSVDYLAEDVAASPVQHFWSLAVEEQFYLVWPVLLLAAAWLAHRSRGNWDPTRTAGALLLLAVTIPSLAWSVISTDTEPTRAFFDTGTRMWELGLGGLVALLPRATLRGPVSVAIRVASLLVLLVASIALDASAAWPGVLATVAVVPTAALVHLGGAGPQDWLHRALGTQPMQWIGARSYSLYLWHWPPLAIAAAAGVTLTPMIGTVVVALSVLPAVAAHRLVEEPLRWHPTFRASTGRSLAMGGLLTVVGLICGLAVVAAAPGAGSGEDGEPTTLVIPAEDSSPTAPGGAGGTSTEGVAAPAVEFVGPVGAIALGTDPLRWTDAELLATLDEVTEITPAPAQARDDLPVVYDDNCHTRSSGTEVRTCSYGVPLEGAAAHIVLAGDSKAGQWGEVLADIATDRDWHLTTILKSACELSASVPERSGEPFEPCATWNVAAMAAIADLAPDVVITSQYKGVALDAVGGEVSTDALVRGMVDAYATLEADGIDVVILMDNFSPFGNVYECVAENLDDLRACAFERPGRPSRDAQMRVAERGGHDVIDLNDHICPTPTCLPIIGNVLVYRQTSHISQTYANTLVDVLDARLAPLVEAAAAS